MTARTQPSGKREWLIDILVGGGIGAVTGAIVAVNFVILVGTSDGYESSIAEVFNHNFLAGLVTVAILGLAPVVGVWLARRRRRSRL